MDDHSRIAIALCKKVKRRIEAAGGNACMSDLMQEAMTTDYVARGHFVEGRGAKMSTYCSRAILNRLNLVADREIYRARFERYQEDLVDEGMSILDAVCENCFGVEPSQILDERENAEAVDEFVEGLSVAGQAIARLFAFPTDSIQRETARRMRQTDKPDKKNSSVLKAVSDYLLDIGYTKNEINKGIKELKLRAGEVV